MDKGKSQPLDSRQYRLSKKQDTISGCVVCGASIFNETDGVCGECHKNLGSADPVTALQIKLKKTQAELGSVQDEYFNIMQSLGRLHKKALKTAVRHSSVEL